MNIQQAINKFIAEGGQARTITLSGVPGVLFTAEDDNNEFIPWGSLGYNKDLGFYNIAQFPGQHNEAGPNYHPVRYHVEGGADPEDDYIIWAVAVDDGSGAIIIGNWADVLKLHHTLKGVVESGEAEWVEELDERLDHPWLNPSQAARFAAERCGITVTRQAIWQACQRGEIRLTNRESGNWRMPQFSLVAWLSNRPKPGPKKD